MPSPRHILGRSSCVGPINHLQGSCHLNFGDHSRGFFPGAGILKLHSVSPSPKENSTGVKVRVLRENLCLCTIQTMKMCNENRGFVFAIHKWILLRVVKQGNPWFVSSTQNSLWFVVSKPRGRPGTRLSASLSQRGRDLINMSSWFIKTALTGTSVHPHFFQDSKSSRFIGVSPWFSCSVLPTKIHQGDMVKIWSFPES